jgi:hypothetical protein
MLRIGLILYSLRTHIPYRSGHRFGFITYTWAGTAIEVAPIAPNNTKPYPEQESPRNISKLLIEYQASQRTPREPWVSTPPVPDFQASSCNLNDWSWNTNLVDSTLDMSFPPETSFSTEDCTTTESWQSTDSWLEDLFPTSASAP